MIKSGTSKTGSSARTTNSARLSALSQAPYCSLASDAHGHQWQAWIRTVFPVGVPRDGVEMSRLLVPTPTFLE